MPRETEGERDKEREREREGRERERWRAVVIARAAKRKAEVEMRLHTKRMDSRMDGRRREAVDGRRMRIHGRSWQFLKRVECTVLEACRLINISEYAALAARRAGSCQLSLT